MFPIRDHNPSTRVPYVTYAIMAINILVFVLNFPKYGNERLLLAFYSDYAAVPAWVTQGEHLYTVITSMFLHGGFMHLFGNMLFLWIFGDNIEDSFGHIGFLIFYLVCGVIATYSHILMEPTSTTPLVGASGAIAGVMGAYMLLFPKARVDVIIILIIYIRYVAVPAFVVLLIWIALQVFGVFSAQGAGGVAYGAHLGGFAVGVLLTIPYFLRHGGMRFWFQNDYHPPHPGTAVPEPRLSDIPRVVRRR